jgi:predicted homoserine dehydrogenase-like protein
VREMSSLLPHDDLMNGGLVDYALGAEPHTGAFVVVYEEHPRKRKELAYYKMGDGPFYVFYTPYHLPHIQIVSSIARAALGGDPTVSPAGAPRCDVATIAKRDLKAGEVLDGVGGFMTYGTIDNADVVYQQGLLPMGVAGGSRLLRDVAKDAALTYADIALPTDRLCDQLRLEQGQRFSMTGRATSPQAIDEREAVRR